LAYFSIWQIGFHLRGGRPLDAMEAFLGASSMAASLPHPLPIATMRTIASHLEAG
jgi:hypothetical protein